MEQAAAEICEAWWFVSSATLNSSNRKLVRYSEIPFAPLQIKEIKVSQYVSSRTAYVNE